MPRFTGYLTILAFVGLGRSLATPYSRAVPTIWDKLNTTLHGRLEASIPFSRPCFPDANPGVLGTYDPQQCQNVMDGYGKNTYRVEYFGSYMNTQWETCQSTNDQCLLNNFNLTDTSFTSFNCSQGSIPNYYVRVVDEKDAIAAYDFAKQNKVSLVIKNTGHDYAGRSSIPNSLALWTHGLQSINYVPKYVEKGCPANSPSQPAVTFGAGVSHGQLYEFADARNLTIPGGSDFTVGAAGGYLQGGGHSSVSNAYGLAVNRVLEFKVVTPDGKLRWANRCQNSDLFFALRGGGGGTFGVVLEVTEQVFPQVSLPTVTVTIDGAGDKGRILLQHMTDNAINYSLQGWGGYIVPRKHITWVNPVLNETAARASMESLRVLTTETLGGEFTFTVEPSYLSFYNKYVAPRGVPVGLNFITTSRLITNDHYATEATRKNLVDKLLPVLDFTSYPIIFQVSPYYYSQHHNTSGTSVSEAWYNSLWHVTSSIFWSYDASPETRQAIYANMTTNMDALRQLAPNGGAYQNEADVYEPDFEKSFWGENYSRLVQIKRKYDPNHLLDCWHCVDWKGQNHSNYKCYMDMA